MVPKKREGGFRKKKKEEMGMGTSTFIIRWVNFLTMVIFQSFHLSVKICLKKKKTEKIASILSFFVCSVSGYLFVLRMGLVLFMGFSLKL